MFYNNQRLHWWRGRPALVARALCTGGAGALSV